MSLLTIPLTASPAQTLDVVLNGQFISLYLQQRTDKLYIDVSVDKKPVVQGRICQNRNKIINEEYRGFIGELFFLDIGGSSDPDYREIGVRYFLIYWDGQNG